MAQTITSLSDAKEALQRVNAQLRNLRERGTKEIQRVTILGTHAGLTLVGGAASGVLQAKKPLIGGKYPTDAVIGSAMCTTALLGLAGEYSDELNAMGAGMVAAYLSREVEQVVRKRSAA